MEVNSLGEMGLMKNFWALLTIGLVVCGFVVPIAWGGALITGLLAIASAPAGKRPDGQTKTGGLLGGVWDDFVIGYKMMDCPFCKSKIMRDAKKCPNCAEWVVEQE